jgi:hypothetical protein
MVMHEDEVADIWEDEGVAVDEVVDEVRVRIDVVVLKRPRMKESQRHSES